MYCVRLHPLASDTAICPIPSEPNCVFNLISRLLKPHPEVFNAWDTFSTPQGPVITIETLLVR